MLRFERLNEASWALLFLDPACERQFGIPASELCALIDAPYACLMEPEVRHRLHDNIQLQLAQQAHYLVNYTLHSAHGPVRLMEMGEPFKQHGRQLLRGYLIVTAESSALTQPASSSEDQQRQQRSHAQQSLIVRLARQRYTTSDPLREAA